MRNWKLEELQLTEPWPGSHAWAAQNANQGIGIVCGADILIACIVAPVQSSTQRWEGGRGEVGSGSSLRGIPVWESRYGRVGWTVRIHAGKKEGRGGQHPTLLGLKSTAKQAHGCF